MGNWSLSLTRCCDQGYWLWTVKNCPVQAVETFSFVRILCNNPLQRTVNEADGVTAHSSNYIFHCGQEDYALFVSDFMLQNVDETVNSYYW